MSYSRLDVPDTAPARVRQLIKDHVDMQFHDVHCMLRLPMPKRYLRAGCNFAMANTILDLISGASVVLHRPDRFSFRGDRTQLFKDLLASNYSWLPDGSPTDTADRLWGVYRNSLAHTFGVEEPGTDDYKIVRHTQEGLTEADVMALEVPGTQPAWLRPTLEQEANTYKLNVEPLYRGARRTFENLLRDSTRMASVETLLEDLENRAAGQQVHTKSSARSSSI